MNRVLATFSLAVCALLVLALGPAEPAHAHGGRIKPPEPAYKPGDGNRMPGRVPTDPPPTPPPRIPGDPTTGTPGDKPGAPPPGFTPPSTPAPTPRSGTPTRPKAGANGRRSGAGAVPTARSWEMWWELNRWQFFPGRGQTILGTATVTPAPKTDRTKSERARRRLVTRQHIVPFLLKALDPQHTVRDEVRAAAMIALTKLTHDRAAIELVFRHAENPRASNLVRESAALALGMLRRGDEPAQMSGADLDKVRRRLLVLLDDGAAPTRTRAFAALAIGLLGDQPFGDAFTKDGRVITRSLWARVQAKGLARDLPVALLTAVGMQPRAGTSTEIKGDLQRIVYGRRIGRRSWDANERSHALAALVRQEGTGWATALFRVLTAKRVPAPVRQAAFIALGAKSGVLSAAQRLEAADAVEKGVRLSRDNLTRGLGLIAMGRLVQADVAADSAAVVQRSGLCGTLLGEARHGAVPLRGFAALALALATRPAASGEADVLAFRTAGRGVLAQGFERTKDARLRSAYAVALGLLGDATPPEVRAQLAEVLADRSADPRLRGHVAVSLAQMGERSSGVRKALRTALWDRRSVELRSQAALALSFLGGRAETSMLVQELRNARSQWVLQQVAAALGQLGDIGAVPAILEVAADEGRADEARALAIASLGLLGDPEAKPSMLRLTLDANYPARTDALHEAFSIL